MRGGFQGRMVSGKEETFSLSKLHPRALPILYKYARPYVGRLLLATLAMFVATVTTLIGPYLTLVAVDDYIMVGNLSGLNWLLLAMVASYGMLWLSSYWQTYLASFVGQNMIRDLRLDLFRHLHSLPIDFFRSNKTGHIMSRITHDVNALHDLMTTGFIHLLHDLFTLAGIVILLLVLNPSLALLSFTTIPVIVFMISFLGKKMRAAYREVRERLADLNADLEESVSGIRVVQALNREAINTGKFTRLSWENLKANLRFVCVFSLLFPTMNFSRVLGEALVLWYGGLGVVNGVMSLGVVMAFMGYVRRFFGPLADLSQVYTTYQSAGASLERISAYLFLVPSISEPQEPKKPEGGFAGGFSFEGVCFGYDSKQVIQGLDLKVEPQEILALVGPTGAGKTTLVSLLTRLYDVNQGAVRIDGINIRDLASQSLRQVIAVVPQTVFLSDTSIKENIRYGKPEATDEEIIQVAKKLHAHDFISALPRGYDTLVGEGGTKLSGGQKQLVSFARALVANPRILLLDEATSSVDSHTELLIQNAMEELLRGRTALIIAHRFSTLKHAHRIGVMCDGSLEAIGDHETLMKSSSTYKQLVQSQSGSA